MGSISGNTSETLTTATFTVALTSEPAAGVTVTVTSGDLSEGTVGPASLSFTSGDWSTPQTVTVTGVNDFLIDGPVTYNVTLDTSTSADADYSGLAQPAGTVSVTNMDDGDTAGLSLGSISGNTSETLTTATFTVALTSEPAAGVTVTVTSGDLSEGTVGPASLSFTSGDWSTPQTVTVTGVNDFLIDGPVTYNVTLDTSTSADTDYSGLAQPAGTVSVTNTDNETKTLTVSVPASASEGDGVLGSQGTVSIFATEASDVVVTLSSDDTSELTVPLTVTITAGSTSATFDLTVVDDAVLDGDQVVTVTASAAGYTSGSDTITVQDNESTGPVAHWKLDETSGLTASDSSGSGNHGALTNMTGDEWTPGQIDGALEFDGTDDRVDIGTLDVAGGAMTISMWLKADGFGTEQARLISKAADATVQGHYWMLGTVSSGGMKLRFLLKTDVGGTTFLIATSGDLAAGEWTHAVAVYDGTEMRIYKDGALVGSVAKSGSLSTNAGVAAAIGNQPPGAGSRPFDGLIDDVRIYDRALSAWEIAELHNIAQISVSPDSISFVGRPGVPEVLVRHLTVTNFGPVGSVGAVTVDTSGMPGYVSVAPTDCSLLSGESQTVTVGLDLSALRADQDVDIVRSLVFLAEGAIGVPVEVTVTIDLRHYGGDIVGCSPATPGVQGWLLVLALLRLAARKQRRRVCRQAGPCDSR